MDLAQITKSPGMLFFCLFMVLAGCGKDNFPSGDIASGFKLADESQQRLVMEMMEQSNIPFRFDEQGLLQYPLQFHAAVLGIIRQVSYGEALSHTAIESMVILDDRKKSKYRAQFESKGIPFQPQDIGGVTHIVWLQLHGPQVDEIRQVVEMETRQERRLEAVAKGEMPAFLVDPGS
ncbi:hypothetical protein [Pseudohongiella sp. O18]|uniref:hypothetical protein n=1 Tax=Pseudohongiella sp. O18 TaxID=2904248 RepID=UPI001F27F607|nr:hypothetical protein [Pseudohongiella sp. O18]